MKYILLLASILIFAGCGSGSGTGGIGGGIDTNRSVAAGDLNGDGFTDFVVGHYWGGGPSYLAFRLQDPANPGTFIASRRDVSFTPTAMRIVDLNADGRPDILIISTGGVAVYLQDPAVNGSFPTETTYALPSRPPTISGAVEVLQVGDLNNDGRLDIVALDADGVCVFYQDPLNPGAFLPATTVIQGVGINSLVIEDLNGDGLDDIAFGQSQQNKISIYTQDQSPQGSFTLRGEYAFSGPWYLYAGDLNGDNEPDIVVTNANSIGLFFQNAGQPGHFDGPTVISAGGNVNHVAIADLDQDGLNDLAGVGYYLHSLVVYLQEVAIPGTFLPPDSYPKSYPWDMAIGDFDHDGLLDVVVISSDMTGIFPQDPADPGHFLVNHKVP